MKASFSLCLSVLFVTASAAPVFAGEVAPATVHEEAGPWDGVPLSLWDYEFTPYGWLSGFEGTAGVGGQEVELDVGFDDVFGAVDFVWSHTFAMEKGRFGLLSDFLYADLSETVRLKGIVGSSAELEMKELMIGFAATYRVIDNDRTTVGLVGERGTLWVEEGIDVSPGRIGGPFSGTLTESWWDGIVGVRARHALGEKFFVLAYGDIGAGGSDLTWQLFGGLGYQLRPSSSFLLGYRYLSYDYQEGGFTYDIDTKGPIMGMRIAF